MSIVIITGASSGMGYEMALQLDRVFQKTDEFWLIGRNMDKLNEIKGRIRNNAKCFSMDFLKDESFVQFEEILKIESPKVRMLVNAAGFGLIGNAEDIPWNEQAEMVRVNCEALTKLTTICIPYFVKNARVIQFASSASFLPQPGFAVYAASKAYVDSYSKALSQELKKKCIYVTSVCPGPVDTNFFVRGEKYKKMAGIKNKFMAYPEDVVAKAIKDSYHKKMMSVYSLPMKAAHIASSIIPDTLLVKAMKYINPDK